MTPFDLETRLYRYGIKAYVFSDTVEAPRHFFKFFARGTYRVSSILETLRDIGAEDATWHGNCEFHCFFPIA